METTKTSLVFSLKNKNKTNVSNLDYLNQHDQEREKLSFGNEARRVKRTLVEVVVTELLPASLAHGHRISASLF